MSLDQIRQALEQKQYPIEFKGHWVGGEWINDRRAQSLSGSFNPNDGERIVHVTTSKFLAEQAVEAAYQSFNELKAMPFEKRIEVLGKFKQVVGDYKDLLVTALRQEGGKPLWEAEQDFNSAMRQLDEVLGHEAQVIEHLVKPYSLNDKSKLSLHPLGICAVFQTFSTPLNTVVQSLIAGLVSGCPLVIMPSSHAALSGIILSHSLELLEDLPKGAVNVVFGNYQSFAKCLQDRRVKGVIYSGSREHCDTIRGDFANVLDRELILQSGGKNSVIVHESASVEDAVKLSLWGVVKSAGQLNTSTSRIFVPKEKLEAFSEAIVPVIHNLRIGPSDEGDDPMMGPLYSQKAVDKFLRFQTMAKREADDTLVWGKAYDAKNNGYFVSPGVHVFSSFDNSSSYQSNVFMCPDVVIYPYHSMEEAIDFANTTKASLVTSMLGDPKSLEPYLPLVKSPNVLFNLPTVGADVQPLLSGRELCGGHRLNRFGLISLMTYPQACQSGEHFESIMSEWPWSV